MHTADQEKVNRMYKTHSSLPEKQRASTNVFLPFVIVSHITMASRSASGGGIHINLRWPLFEGEPTCIH